MAEPTTGRWAQLREERLQSPEARERYERGRRVLGTIQAMVEAVDAERARAGLSKAALARRIGAQPAVVQRLLRAGPTDPALKTLLEMLDVLGVQVRLARQGATAPAPQAADSDRTDARADRRRSRLAV